MSHKVKDAISRLNEKIATTFENVLNALFPIRLVKKLFRGVAEINEGNLRRFEKLDERIDEINEPEDWCGNKLSDYDLDDFVNRDNLDDAINDSIEGKDFEEKVKEYCEAYMCVDSEGNSVSDYDLSEMATQTDVQEMIAEVLGNSATEFKAMYGEYYTAQEVEEVINEKLSEWEETFDESVKAIVADQLKEVYGLKPNTKISAVDELNEDINIEAMAERLCRLEKQMRMVGNIFTDLMNDYRNLESTIRLTMDGKEIPEDYPGI